ncbi:hypothetical protein REPUB_Repub02eG0092500 [Reevesia pubescens]
MSIDSMLLQPLLSSMESSSSSSFASSNFLSYWIYLNLILLRWLLAWKLVLIHVPLVQEIFGLRKKPVKSKPPTRRLSRYYNSIDSHNSTSQ